MNIRNLVVVSALAFCSAANADIETVVSAVETVTSNISVPTSGNGRLMFRPCDDACEEKFIAARLTENTAFFVNGERVDFLGFRQAFFNMRRSQDGYALVAYDTDSKTVTRVNIGT